MPKFQSEINDAKRLAASLGFGRLTFGWKEWDPRYMMTSSSGSVSVTSAAPQVLRTYQSGRSDPWLSQFNADMRQGVFGFSALDERTHR